MAFGFATFSCLLLAAACAQAASVTWTIDTTLTTLGASATGRAPISGLTLNLRLVQQGTNPLPSLTPTLPFKLGGTLVTDTDFTSSIKFLANANIDGLITGNFKPKADGSDAAEPADVGFTAQAKFGPTFISGVDGAIRNMLLDFSGGDAIAISGGSFPTTTVTASVINGQIDYRGYGPGAALGSGSESLSLILPGDANFNRVVDGGDYTIWADNFLTGPGKTIATGDFSGDGIVDGADYTLWADNFLATGDPFPGVLNSGANASISKVGSNYKLTLPLVAAIAITVDEGDDTATTTDDIFVDFKMSGTIVAFAPSPASATSVPEPSTLVLSLIGGLGLAAVGAARRLRRR